MLKNLFYFPDRHTDPILRSGLWELVSSKVKNKSIDAVFLENHPSWVSLPLQDIVNNIPLNEMEIHASGLHGAEFYPLIDQHIQSMQEVYAATVAVTQGGEYALLSNAMAKEQALSKKRINLIIHAVLQTSATCNYENPALICGRKHEVEISTEVKKRGLSLIKIDSYLPKNLDDDSDEELQKTTEYTAKLFLGLYSPVGFEARLIRIAQEIYRRRKQPYPFTV